MLSINKEGLFTIGVCIVATILIFLVNSSLGLICAGISAIVVYFFRDPQRVIPAVKDVVLSPADGVICGISECKAPEICNTDVTMKKISIFLSPLNVHVNRIPFSGTVKKLNYVPGKSIRADYDSSESKNERQETLIETENGTQIVVFQQTGFLTRRIVCNLKQEQEVQAGKRFGIIKFGSRVTIYLPQDVKILVEKGQTATAGETMLATFGNELPLEKEFFVD